MAHIELSGKWAVGQYRYAQVDDADLLRLSAYRWKAKWNGNRNNIYAVRNTLIAGKPVTVRMHREVVGLEFGDPREVDHLDHFGLNNTRSNLRIASRSENLLNGRRLAVAITCQRCGCSVTRITQAVAARRVTLCEACAARPAPVACAVCFPTCQFCGRLFTARRSNSLFCSDRCRCADERRRGVRR
jgi:hypothetical protein